MELVAVLAVVIVVCLILGVSPATLGLAGIGLVMLGIFASTILFVFFFARLLRSRKTDAEFLRVDKPEGARFSSAFYLAEGEERPCVFPSEPKIMYKKGARTRVRLHEKSGKVFDRFATVTCVLGLIFGLAASSGAAAAIYYYFAFEMN